MRVLHLIEQLSLGGAARALVAAARLSSRAGRADHRIVSLRPPDPAAAAVAADAGLALVAAEQFAEAAREADVVHIHFWNSPDLYAALAAELPPARVVLTCHVNGATTPQILTPEIVAFADLLLATSPITLEGADSALRRKAMLAPSGADFSRLAGFAPRPHAGFSIGYVGTLDFGKLHPDYVSLHAAITIPAARVHIHGDGAAAPTLARQIAASGAGGRFSLGGYARDLVAAFSELDVFGYPLCEDNYSTSDLVLQEAMCAGLPSVVFAHGGAARLITDGETGFVVRTAAEYVDRIVRLHDRPGERARMARAAAEAARSHFGVNNLGPLIDAAYERVMAAPKRERPPIPSLAGAAAFMRSLGPAAGDFQASQSGSPADAADADTRIAAAHPALASARGGGVLHYRGAYPDDPWLRLWSGLVLLGQGRPALAAAEFTAAAKQGISDGRPAAYLSRAIDAGRTPSSSGRSG